MSAPIPAPVVRGPDSRVPVSPELSLHPDPSMRPDDDRRQNQKAAKAVRPVKPRRHGLYAAAWACSGLIAGTYVFALILRQDGGPLLARMEAVEPAALAKTQADIAQIRSTMGQLEGDVARIKIDQAQADEREKQLVGRVATVETRVNQFGEQIAAAVAAPAKQASTTAAATAPAKTPAARIATAAIPPASPAPQPQAVAPATGEASAGVLLARGPSLDALRLSWSLLNERHKATLKSMEPRVVEVEPGSYQLVAGPVANPAEALKVCSALKARGVSCQATDFRGKAF